MQQIDIPVGTSRRVFFTLKVCWSEMSLLDQLSSKVYFRFDVKSNQFLADTLSKNDQKAGPLRQSQ
jgi:hypothetical protein